MNGPCSMADGRFLPMSGIRQLRSESKGEAVEVGVSKVGADLAVIARRYAQAPGQMLYSMGN